MKTFKKILPLLALAILTAMIFSSFKAYKRTKSKRYAFVSLITYPPSYSDQKSTHMISNVVDFECDKDRDDVLKQFTTYLKAEHKVNVSYYQGFARIFESYDAAVAGRRKRMAEDDEDKPRKTYNNFFVTCED